MAYTNFVKQIVDSVLTTLNSGKSISDIYNELDKYGINRVYLTEGCTPDIFFNPLIPEMLYWKYYTRLRGRPAITKFRNEIDSLYFCVKPVGEDFYYHIYLHDISKYDKCIKYIIQWYKGKDDTPRSDYFDYNDICHFIEIYNTSKIGRQDINKKLFFRAPKISDDSISNIKSYHGYIFKEE